MKIKLFFMIFLLIYFVGCSTKNYKLDSRYFFKDNAKFLNDTSLILAKITNKTALGISLVKEYNKNNKLVFKTKLNNNDNQILCNNGYKLEFYFSNGKSYKTKCKNLIILK